VPSNSSVNVSMLEGSRGQNATLVTWKKLYVRCFFQLQIKFPYEKSC